jgi:hypothetical protein
MYGNVLSMVWGDICKIGCNIIILFYEYYCTACKVETYN